MTKAKLMELVMSGQTVLVGTYLSGRVEDINMRVKTGPDAGKMRVGHVRRETIITEQDAVVVGGFLSDSENPLDFKPAVKKNEPCAVLVTKIETIQGFKLFAGKVEPLTA